MIKLNIARDTFATAMRARGVPDPIVVAWHGHDKWIMRAANIVTGVDHLTQAANAIQGRFREFLGQRLRLSRVNTTSVH